MSNKTRPAFLLHRSDGRVRVRRQQGERFREDCVIGTVMAGGGSVDVWAEKLRGCVCMCFMLFFFYQFVFVFTHFCQLSPDMLLIYHF